MNYPAVDSATSQAAADSLDPRATVALREQIFDLIKVSPDGLTDEEIQDTLRLKGNTQRPRRWELSHKQGRIRQSGTRETRTGRQAAVWVANEYPKTPVKAPIYKNVMVVQMRDGWPVTDFITGAEYRDNATVIPFPNHMSIQEGDRLILK